MILFKNDDNLLEDFRFIKSDIEQLNLEFKNILTEKIDE